MNQALAPILQRRRVLKALAWAAGLALTWTLVAGLALPRLIRGPVERLAAEALGTPVQIDRLAFHPWALVLRVEGLRLGPNDAPWVRLEALSVDVSAQTLSRWAPVVERITVQAPVVHLVREADGRLNIAPVLERLAGPSEAPPREGPPPRFALHNLSLERGALQFEDRASGTLHRVEGLSIGLPFLSNLPSQVEIDVQPRLEAVVNGSPLALQAQARPFSPEQAATLSLRLEALDLAWWVDAAKPWLAASLPEPWPAEPTAGRLDLALQLAFRRDPADTDAPPQVQLRADAQVDGLALKLPAQDGELRWQRLALQGLTLEPLVRRVHLDALRLLAPQLALDPARLKPAAAVAPAAAPVSPPAAASAPAPWHWSVGRLQLEQGALWLDGREPVALSALAPQPPALPPLPAPASGSGPAASAVPAPSEVPASGPAGDAAAASAVPAEPALQAPGRLGLQALQLTVEGLASDPAAAPPRWVLGAADGRAGRLAVRGTVIPPQAQGPALQADLAVDLESWDLKPWTALLKPLGLALPLELHGATLGAAAQLDARLAADGALNLSVQGGRVSLKGLDVQAPGGGEPPPAARRPRAADAGAGAGAARGPRPWRPEGAAENRLRLDALELDGLRLALAPGQAPELGAEALKLRGLKLAATRGQDARLPWLEALIPPAVAAPPAAVAPARQAAGRGRPPAPPAAATMAPRWSLGRFECEGCALRFDDFAVRPRATLALDRLGVQLQGLDHRLTQPIAFKLDTRAQGEGRLQVEGSVRPQPLKLQAKLDLSPLQLAVLQPYLAPHLNLVLERAELRARGELSLEGHARQPVASVAWRGSAGLERLLTRDRLNDAEFLRLKALSLDGTQLRWTPERLQADLGRIDLQDFYSRIIVNADARLNLLDIVKRREGEADRSITTPQPAPAPAPTPAAPAASAPAGAAAPPPELRWTSITLRGGQVDFTDNFIKPNYSAKLGDLQGSLSAVAWDDPKPATVSIAGKVDGSAPLAIDGTVHPLGARLATDLVARAQGIELTRLSSYSGRYAGYGIEKGTLSVELRYRIEQGKLDASNKIVLNQLTFGDKVESPDALKLPLQLAVSLLQDRHGVIDIDLPISGSLDDPQFSVGRVILRAIVNLIGRAITAPFSLIARAFSGGGAGQDLSALAFAPGSAELDEAARKQLDQVAKVLLDKPGLRLEATGLAEPGVDVEGLRRAQVERQIRAAKARSQRKTPEEVSVEPSERARWLEAAYKAAELPNKPRNLIGLQKSLPAEEMEARLAAAAPADEAALRGLADERGNRVKAYLVGRLPAERVLLTRSKVQAEAAAPAASAPEDGAPAPARGPRVQFILQ